MTEKEMKYLWYLNVETECLQKDLQELELELQYFDGYKGNKISDMPKARGLLIGYDRYDQLVELMDKKTLLAEQIRLNLIKIQKERMRLEKHIDKITDGEIRLIVRLRHINRMTWEEIGDELHMDRRTVSRKYQK